LIGGHICVQKPFPDSGWRVSLYPWGDKISYDFFGKADAIEYAKDVEALKIDWRAVYAAENYVRSEPYFSSLAMLIEVRDRYEADGFFKPPQ
jgi:hypothetical protein